MEAEKKIHLKELEAQMLAYIDILMKENVANKQWLSIAKTHFEEGTMAAVRAVYTPIDQ